jgi:hypothetical protein
MVALQPIHCRFPQAQAEESDNRPDNLIAALAARQHGVVSAEELAGLGLSSDAIRNRVRAGRLHQHHRGVYAVGHPNLTLFGRFVAALKAVGPGAQLSHASATALFEMEAWDDDRVVEVTKAGTAPGRHRGVYVHRTLVPDPPIVVHGIPVTTPARTLLDLAARLPDKRLRRLVRQAYVRDLVTHRELLATVERLRPRRGVGTLVAILQAGPVPTRSEFEDILLDLVLAEGFAPPDVNVPLHLDGRRVIPDLRWPAHRLCVEADGRMWHADPISVADDAERQALLEASGERVLRVTWRQALDGRARTVARIAAAGAPRLSDRT